MHQDVVKIVLHPIIQAAFVVLVSACSNVPDGSSQLVAAICGLPVAGCATKQDVALQFADPWDVGLGKQCK